MSSAMSDVPERPTLFRVYASRGNTVHIARDHQAHKYAVVVTGCSEHIPGDDVIFTPLTTDDWKIVWNDMTSERQPTLCRKCRQWYSGITKGT